MAEGTYEYECMRAELLGIDPPNYDEFMKKKIEREAQEAQSEEIDAENIKEAEAQNEEMKNISGGLDELNNILSITQKKIDRFKVRCGSITNLLKLKVGSLAGEGSSQAHADNDENGTEETSKIEQREEEESQPTTETKAENGQRKSDLAKALDNHVDKLDAMLEKAENAHYSMAHQNKQMKKFLK